jgi:hypothetical protein
LALIKAISRNLLLIRDAISRPLGKVKNAFKVEKVPAAPRPKQQQKCKAMDSVALDKFEPCLFAPS